VTTRSLGITALSHALGSDDERAMMDAAALVDLARRAFNVGVQVFSQPSPDREDRLRRSRLHTIDFHKHVQARQYLTPEPTWTFSSPSPTSSLHRQRRVSSKMVSSGANPCTSLPLTRKLISFAPRRLKYVYPPSWPLCLHSMAMDVLTEGPLMFITD
jgi:hypothetical protein